MKPDSKTVSVIIPAYNASLSLRECIESVLHQSRPAYEIIVVNDGSKDDTAQIARSYGDAIVYLEQANQGQGAARNVGLEIAKGKFVAFLDADDFWLPGFLEKTISFLEENTEAVCVSSAFLIRSANGEEQLMPKAIMEADAFSTAIVLDDFFSFWASHDHVRTGTVLIRKSVIDQAGGQRSDLRISQDLEYWGYLATFGKWGFIPEPLWVGNSRVVAAKAGWIYRYSSRRKLCPTVEAWQKRIMPRLQNTQIGNFNIVRGRVALGYTHNHIIGGDRSLAFDIVKNFGNEFPKNRLAYLLIIFGQLGPVGWWFICNVVKSREYFKSVTIKYIIK